MSLKPLFGGKKARRKEEVNIVPEGMNGGIFYIRVSTDKQEERGNGLEAQKETILKFAEQHKIFNLHPNNDFYIEIGSGGLPIEKRPVLAEAIEATKRHNAYLVTSKLDRLSRKSAMVNTMLEDKFNFVTVEHGFHTEAMFIRILAAVAQKEKELISERTAAGLKQVKRRYEEDYKRQIEAGVENPVMKKLGIPNVDNAPDHISHKRRKEGLERSEKYLTEMIEPAIRALEKEGNGKRPNRKQIADKMNELGFVTDYGSPFTESIIYHTMRKFKNRKKVEEMEARKINLKENESERDVRSSERSGAGDVRSSERSERSGAGERSEQMIRSKI